MTANKWEAKRKAQFLNRCIHYPRSWEDTHCAVGVDLDAIWDKSERPYRRICYSPKAAIPCDKRELPTEADYEAYRQELENSLTRMVKIAEAIGATGQKQGRIDCPCCNGVVGFSIASNGHMAAACSTDGCAKWSE